MAAPYSNFDAVAGFQIFFPMPSEVDDLADQNDWENGLMIGNGPYKLDEPRSDTEVVVVRNDEWGGDIFGNTRATLDKITFVVSGDIESAFNAFEAGEGDTGRIPPGRFTDAQETYGNTVDVRVLGTYHFEVRWDDPVLGGPENKLLRQAISQAINRDEINEAVYEGTRIDSTGITPAGIPGFGEGLCDYCTYDEDAAQKAFDDWKAAGNSIANPIKINLNAGGGHEPVVQIMIDNLSAIGIPAVADPLDSTTYFTQLTDGACTICRSGWYADYPTYDNFMFDLFHSTSIGGNNHGFYSNPKFDDLVDEAKSTVDPEARGQLFRDAEQVLLNEDIGVIPINWRTGDYVFNEDRVSNFEQNPQGLIYYETVTVQ
jgi:ABC-type transport system substrate-binding protein